MFPIRFGVRKEIDGAGFPLQVKDFFGINTKKELRKGDTCVWLPSPSSDNDYHNRCWLKKKIMR